MQPQSGAERGAGLESLQRLLKQRFSRHWEFKDQKKKAAPAHSVCMVSDNVLQIRGLRSLFLLSLPVSLPSFRAPELEAPSFPSVGAGWWLARRLLCKPFEASLGGHLRMGFRERTAGIHGPVLTRFLSPRLCWVSRHGGGAGELGLQLQEAALGAPRPFCSPLRPSGPLCLPR